eukprot:5087501-Prymnesium_polylepis.1
MNLGLYHARFKVVGARSHRGSWPGRMAARLEPGAAGQLACSDIDIVECVRARHKPSSQSASAS